MNYISPEDFLRDYDKPGLLSRVKRLPPFILEQMTLEVEQFRRAENGERARPDLTPNGFGLRRGPVTSPGNNLTSRSAPLGLPAPFMPPEQHRADYVDNPKQLQKMRERVERINNEGLAEALQEKMGTDADLPEEPVTLREQIEAAAEIHSLE